jgi:hypothetical protein
MGNPAPRSGERWYGKYSGEVGGNEDPQKQGRVQVKVPTIFGADLQVWARPCFAYGHFFVPPVGAKVWVEFEAGDPQYPIWSGAWYPQANTPEESRVTPPDNRVIQTASGHTIELNDTSDSPKITIRHKDNSFVAIDDKGSVVVANKNGSTLYLNADQGEVSLFSEHGHMLSMKSGGIAIINKDQTSLDITGDTVRITAANIILDGGKVSLGTGASEATLLATQFQNLWTQFLVHTHPSAMGPTGPATPPLPIIPLTHCTAAVLVK